MRPSLVTFVLSFLRKDTALMPRKLVKALAEGIDRRAQRRRHLRLRRHRRRRRHADRPRPEVLVHRHRYAGGSLLLTAIYTALIVWIIGLAVPVTASYIICAVIAAPALIKLGVPDYAAHMFIFYYAVLSEVSPPTALSPFAAAAITGGDPYRTTLQSWKYTLPAFLVPFVFVLRSARRRPVAVDPEGRIVGGYCRDHLQDHLRPAGARGLRAELGVCDKIRRSSAGCFCYPDCCWCSRA